MARIHSFEEIEAWKASHILIKEIYLITNQSLFSTDYGLKDQMRRAAVSISANIAEGFERETTKTRNYKRIYTISVYLKGFRWRTSLTFIY